MRFYLTLALGLLFSPIAAAQQEHEHAHPAPATDANTVTLMLTPEQLPAAGQATRVTAQLTLNGKPLEADDLKIVHTQKFHLLLVNPALTDYQHIHPQPTATPGSYLFTFTPKSAQNYCAWADVTPLGSTQTFAPALMGEMTKLATPETLNTEVTVDDYHFTLAFDTPPKVGQASMGTIHITNSDGQPVKTLQPVMGAFAHIVAFSSNCEGVMHTHPMGEEPQSDAARGGPDLMFHLMPEKAGYVKLFAQVKIGDKELFVPFGLKVSE